MTEETLLDKTNLSPLEDSIASISRSLLDKVLQRKALGGVDLLGFSTGLARVDDHTGGMQRDQLWLVGARSGVGKTGFVLGVSIEGARQGKTVMLYSLEMGAEQIVNRLVSSMTQIPGGRIIRGKIDGGELIAVRNALEEINDLKFAIVDKTVSSEKILEHAREYADRESPIDLLVVDYVGILGDAGGFGEVERLSKISRTLRTIANPLNLDCTVLAAAQLNRASEQREDHRPTTTDVRGTDALLQDCNVGLLLYRPAMSEQTKGAKPLDREDDAEIIIGKNREGAVLSTAAVFHPKLVKWTQASERPVAEPPPKKTASKPAPVKPGSKTPLQDRVRSASRTA